MEYSERLAIFKSLKIKDIRRILFGTMPNLQALSEHISIKRSEGALYIDASISWIDCYRESVQSAHEAASSFKENYDILRHAYEQLLIEETGVAVQLRAVVEDRRVWFMVADGKDDLIRCY